MARLERALKVEFLRVLSDPDDWPLDKCLVEWVREKKGSNRACRKGNVGVLEAGNAISEPHCRWFLRYMLESPSAPQRGRAILKEYLAQSGVPLGAITPGRVDNRVLDAVFQPAKPKPWFLRR